MINNLLNIFSKIENKAFVDKIDLNYLKNILNWDIINNILETSDIPFNSFLQDKEHYDLKDYSSLFDFIYDNKFFFLKKAHFFDYNLLNWSIEISKQLKTYINISFEINTTNKETEIPKIEGSDIIFFQVSGNSYIEVFDENNKLYFTYSLNEGDLIYMPNNYKIIKKSMNLSLYLYLYIIPLSNSLYLKWLSDNIVFDNNFIIDPFAKDNLNKFIDEFKNQILEIVNESDKKYLKKQFNVINMTHNKLDFPSILAKNL